MQKKVSVYVDGFNLYYAIKDLQNNRLQWVDLWVLSEKLVRKNETVTVVKYFSAYFTWNEATYRRHQRYVTALKAEGVQFIAGNFKWKTFECPECNSDFSKPEEKETDVNIGAHLLADACKDRFDRALIISADTDLNQAVNLARKETIDKQIDIVAPPGRRLRNRATLFEISRSKLRSSLLSSDTINTIVRDGR